MQTHVAQVTRVYYTVQNTEERLGGWDRGAGFVGAPGQCVTPVTNREEQRQGWMRWQSGSGSGRVLRTKTKQVSAGKGTKSVSKRLGQKSRIWSNTDEQNVSKENIA